MAKSQLTITPNKTATYLANKLVATSGTLGVTVSNAVLTCDSNANGEFTGSSNLGIGDGIVLGSGDVATNMSLSTFGLDGLPADFASSVLGMPGDAQLSAIVSISTYDACVLEFDLQPVGSFIEFEYVFGSEEYPEFNCLFFNDVFSFFITGPGFTTPTNIALLPGTSTPVSINTVNDGTGSCSPPANTALYVNNTDTTNTMDGFTLPLIATATVTPGSLYHLKLAIADASDMILNSYVILKANSLKSGGSIPSGMQALNTLQGVNIYPSQNNSVFVIENKLNQDLQIAITDMNGRTLLKRQMSKSSPLEYINFSNFDTGMYFAKIVNVETGASFTQKIIK
ncbi:MAG: T9SS type A sorting domain-containing protein [Bacteroidetes bacterium]|nr:T9SS type A sorting domain-containing protein [Bacteroidota bacterium]